MRAWTAIGAPLDSAGRGEGEERAPAALREAGLVSSLDAADLGDLEARITTDERDSATGIIGYADVVSASRAIRDRVAAISGEGRRPLVIGGDCTVLVGALAGVRALGPVGLVMVDAHLDCHDGRSSPTGECADMDLAIAIGRGPDELAGLADGVAAVEPADVVVIGFREPDSSAEPAVASELDLVDPRVEVVKAGSIIDPSEIGARAVARMREGPGRFWLHLDADAIDPELMPAVSYREPGGLSWDGAAALLDPIGGSDSLCGVSVSDLNSDRDPGGRYARRLATLVAGALRRRPADA